MNRFRIGHREIGPGRPVYVVAEMSANHNGTLQEALRIVRAAKASGADAIKTQTYTADTLTIRSDRPHFRISGGTLWDGKTLHDLYSQAFTPWEWQAPLKAEAESVGLDFFSAAFDASAVDFLETLGVPAHKVASFEVVDTPLIRKMAATGKPLIVSTGMATFEEIADAVEVARGVGCNALALLKCTSAYPAAYEEMNLASIAELARRFAVPAGLSDHTLGTAIPSAAVASGAVIVEKHFTLSRAVPGPDSAFSLEPHEFRQMVDAIRAVEKAMGRPAFGPTESERKSVVFRRSLFIVEDMKAGEPLTERNLRSIRPGHGLPPKFYEALLGRRVTADVARGTPLSWDLVEGGRP